MKENRIQMPMRRTKMMSERKRTMLVMKTMMTMNGTIRVHQRKTAWTRTRMRTKTKPIPKTRKITKKLKKMASKKAARQRR